MSWTVSSKRRRGNDLSVARRRMMADEFQARAPSDNPVPLLIGLVGPSSSGKTFSALRLATGAVRVLGGAIHVIDTEAERARHYRSLFQFKHVPFGKPYSSLRYLAAIQSQVQQGASVIIVDSMSHEHEGPGGYLEMQKLELDKLAGDDWQKRKAMNFIAWSYAAAPRRALIGGVTALNAMFIFCFRAKEKLIIARGKEPVDGGWQPISGDEFIFEQTVRALLPPASDGVPDWSPQRPGEVSVPKLPVQFRELFKPGQALCENHGEALARWARGATSNASPPPVVLQSNGGELAGAPSPAGAPAYVFTLINGRGDLRTTNSAAQWLHAVMTMLKKPYDTAERFWTDNYDYIIAARAAGFVDETDEATAFWEARRLDQ